MHKDFRGSRKFLVKKSSEFHRGGAEGKAFTKTLFPLHCVSAVNTLLHQLVAALPP
jgi:hypothetical protein